jgi:hypothetical protein
MKIVDFEKLNFVVDNFFIWIRLGPQTINLYMIWYNIWGTEMEYRHKWKKGVMVEELTRVGVCERLQVRFLLSAKFQKIALTGHLGAVAIWLVGGSLPQLKKFKKILFFRFGLYRVSQRIKDTQQSLLCR